MHVPATLVQSAMAGYLDTYGASDEKRSRRIKRIVYPTLGILIAGAMLFAFFRNFQEERAVNRFLEAVRAKNYQEAYRIWGCTEQTPCRDYSFERFMEDWGPAGPYADAAAVKVTNTDSCGDGVVMTLQVPNEEPFGIWVERKTDTLGYAPWPRCPGRHWNLKGFLKSFFSDPPKPEVPKR